MTKSNTSHHQGQRRRPRREYGKTDNFEIYQDDGTTAWTWGAAITLLAAVGAGLFTLKRHGAPKTVRQAIDFTLQTNPNLQPRAIDAFVHMYAREILTDERDDLNPVILAATLRQTDRPMLVCVVRGPRDKPYIADRLSGPITLDDHDQFTIGPRTFHLRDITTTFARHGQRCLAVRAPKKQHPK